MKRYYCLLKHTTIIACLLVLMFSISSCRTTKTASAATSSPKVELKKAEVVTHAKEEAVVDLYDKSNSAIPVFSAKIKVDAKVGEKLISLNGSLKIKKDEVIQLSFQAPIIGIEMGKLEITPDYILVIDRYHKQYVKAPISELTARAKTNLDFYDLQALFTNQIFLPGVKDVSRKTLEKFDLNSVVADQSTTLTLSDKQLKYVFSLITSGDLSQSQVLTSNSKYKLIWDYKSFKKFENRNFPRKMAVQFVGGKTPVEMDIEISKISDDSDWDTYTNVSGKYKQISLDDVMKMISNL